VEHRWNEIDRGNPKYSGKTSGKISIWTDPGSNPGLRGGRPAAKRLSYGITEEKKRCEMKPKLKSPLNLK
jgi:hypothetical protein